jgi:hypothetical protein
MRFRNGRKVSTSVFQAVRYVAKVGVITRITWDELFGQGTKRWKRKQLRLLLNAKVLKNHPYEAVRDTFILGEQGLEMIESMKWRGVHLLQPKYIKHDETVAKGLLALERKALCQKWMTESELKSQKSSSFRLHGLEGGAKYPDAVFKLQGKSSSQIVAVEYEKTSKSSWRYNKAIKAYSDSAEFNVILFIVEASAIEDLVKRSMRFIGDGSLNSKIGFINIEDWRQNPLTASIRGLSKGKSLSEIAQKL